MAKSKAKSNNRRGWWILLALLAVIAAIAFIYRAQITGYTQAGTAYTARVACSCHYVAGRSIDDCAKDKIAGAELITIKADDDAKSVTARFPLLAVNTAYYREGYGCVLQRWED